MSIFEITPLEIGQSVIQRAKPLHLENKLITATTQLLVVITIAGARKTNFTSAVHAPAVLTTVNSSFPQTTERGGNPHRRTNSVTINDCCDTAHIE
jgi:hypothetical protein